ncbi:MAG TPA: DUF4410 domain-containing protein [Thermoanaerobaculia bacterium]|jgi:hypothetical protein|nr:DUF4410 domain-containing protein [Thermoanaerobaculia bacterium]
MSKTLLRLSLALVFLSLLALPLAARKGKGPSTEPGKYEEWNDEIDELEVVQTFKLSDYSKVIVEPFDTEGTPLPEKDDNTYEPVQQVLKDPAGPFAEGLTEELGGKITVSQGSGGKGGGTLIVRNKMLHLDPGSKAARYWAGFGAGAARAEVSGEVVDAATGKVLLRFKQERRSGVGVAGGDYVKLMQRNLRTIGEDIALILNAF